MEMRGWLLTLAYSTWSISASPSWNEAGTPDHFWSNSEGSKGSNVSTVQGPFFGGTLHTTVSMPYHLLRVNKVPTRMHWIISHSAPNIYVSITRITQLVPPQPDAVFIQIHDVHPSVHGIASWSTWPNRGRKINHIDWPLCTAATVYDLLWQYIAQKMGICWFYYFCCWLLLFVA